MQVGARRVFRVGFVTATSLALAYGLALQMPFLAPLFGFMLTAAPKPPPGLKGLVGLLLVLAILLGSGLLLTPIVSQYTVVGLLLVLGGLFLANYITLNVCKPQIGLLLTVGVTLITALGLVGFGLAVALIEELMICIAIAVICQWIVYPVFPEDPDTYPQEATPPVQHARSRWLAGRATLIVFPVYLLALTNPTFYAPTIMKAVALGQQTSETDAKHAGLELLGSTLLAGLIAILFWFCLKLAPNLWFFALWMLACSCYLAAKMYLILPTRFAPSFWSNVMITILILVGPAVADSANGRDPYKAFAVRMCLFIAVTLYAWVALAVIEQWRRKQSTRTVTENSTLAGSVPPATCL